MTFLARNVEKARPQPGISVKSHTCTNTHIMLLWQDQLKITPFTISSYFLKNTLLTYNSAHLKQTQFTVRSSTFECADRGVMEHADGANDGTGCAQANTETMWGSISPIWLIPFSFSSLLIFQDNNRWLGANNTANLSALYTHLTLSYTDLYTQATVEHVNILPRIAQGQRRNYHNLRAPDRLDV